MCFSATASFTAATLLALIGSGALYKAKQKYFMVALIPFIFALQQAIEGLLWLSFNGSISSALQVPLAYGYLVFAYGWWPWWIPSALFSIETNNQRKHALKCLALFGAMLASILGFLLLKNGVLPEIVGHHIVYTVFIMQPFGYALWLLAYAAATILPFFVSSHRGTSLYGSLLLAACLASIYFWFYAFGSIWCFWAALLSLSVMVIIK